MRFFVLLSVICLSVSKELDSYKDFKVFAAKNHYKTVSDYANSIGVTQLDTQWDEFKVKFERKYGPEEEEERKFNFLKTIQFIESHNKRHKSGDVSHEVDINQFADWNRDEHHFVLSAKPPSFDKSELADITEGPQTSYFASLPESFDWNEQGKVTPAENQGQCGSCYTFAAIATTESAYAIRDNQTVRLSEQQLVDCQLTGTGCQGGGIDKAYFFIQQNGIESASSYGPYIAKRKNCTVNEGQTHYNISGCRLLKQPTTDQDIMTAIMNNGPVAVGIDASGSDMAYYKTGIISKGNSSLNHYVTAVGWGPGYWIIKNSWGTSWGENGLFKLAQGSNLRGVNDWVIYPFL